MGGRSYKLATLLGIRIGVNASWFVVLFLFIVLFNEGVQETLTASQTVEYAVTVALPAVFFGSIVLHELGHALMARREGIEVAGIDLFFFGGIMRMSRDTDSPGSEFRVAAAGPAVTLLIAALAYGAATLMSGDAGSAVDAATLTGDGVTPVELIVGFLASMNIVLLVFNLIPAYPLDGGRIARALAWRLTGDRERATRIAATLGQGFAYLLMGYGVFLLFNDEGVNGLWLIVLGWMLGQAARGAVAQTRFSEKLRGVTVADIMDAEPVTVPAYYLASQAYEEYYLRYGWDWFAVTERDGRLVGPLQRDIIERVVQTEGGTMPTRELVARDAQQDGRVPADATLETLLGSESLRRLGALMAVDDQNRLRGVVTLEQVTRALQHKLAPG